MIYVELPHDKQYNLPFYLAMEEYIARALPAQDYFFMWQVAPTVIFGRNQLLDTEVDTEFCRRNGIEFYRRKSGGGCVYADNGNIMLSYITPDTNVNFTFNRYMLMVEHALCRLGIEAKSTGRNDILIGGKKVSGNAFYHLPGRSIVHGTMLYDTNLEYMSGATTPSPAKLKSKGVDSVRQHVTTLKEHIPLGLDEFKKSLRDALCSDTIVLSLDDVNDIEKLSYVYTSPDFIYGKNPASALSRSKRIEGVGEIKISIELKNNIIRNANVSGDFFIVGDVDAMLLAKLKGVPFERSAVDNVLASIECGDVIMNLKRKELINLIFDWPMENKRTCLYDKHVALGALISPFGGFDMPIQYTNIVEEHNAVRQACGVFDVSHMGEVLITGAESEKFVNYIFTNDIAGAPDGKIFYGMMCHPTGGVVDDLLVYKMSQGRYFLVINASNIEKDVAWITENAKGFDVAVENQSEMYGEVAVQGPKAEEIVERVLGIHCSDLLFYTCKEVELCGETVIVSRTGYTGEDGFEIYASHGFTNEVWNKLMASGEVAPCGLGCRDTLRFEVGLPLYGDELTDDITPLEASLGMFAKLDKEDFIGKDALVKQKTAGLKRKIVGIELKDRAIPRHGYEVEADGKVIGVVTTGYNSISTGKSVCMALVDIDYAKLDTEVAVRIRKKVFPGVVTKKRFYDKNYKK